MKYLLCGCIVLCFANSFCQTANNLANNQRTANNFLFYGGMTFPDFNYVTPGSGLFPFFETDTVTMLLNQVSEKSLKKNLFFLAGDECQGRMAASHGDSVATGFVEAWMKKHKLKPGAYNSYRQQVLLKETNINNNYSNIRISGQEQKKVKDWVPYNFRYAQANSRSVDLKNVPLVFINYAIDTDVYNDYMNIDVKDKAVVWVGGTPASLQKKLQGKGLSNRPVKAETLAKKGAVAGLVYFPLLNFDVDVPVREKNMDTANAFKLYKPRNADLPFPSMFPQFIISPSLLKSILGSRAAALDSLVNHFDSSKTPLAFETNNTLSFKLDYHEDTSITSPNIIGLIKGTDPAAGYVVFTAHRDHEGMAFGKTWFGADDNASGTAAMMECAKAISALTKEGIRPKKSILFISTAAEEHGLLGAKFFADNPTIPINEIKYEINIDMLGRVDSFYSKKNPDQPYVYALFEDTAKGFKEVLNNINNSYSNLTLDDHYLTDKTARNNLLGRSDQAAFSAKGIPYIWFFSGFHPDYHQPTDTPDKINYKLLAQRTKLALGVLWALANE